MGASKHRRAARPSRGTLVLAIATLLLLLLPATALAASASPMYRLYNPNSGEHFYTANSYERDHVVSAGWRYEGIGWYAPSSGSPVYRLYNPNAGDHHYTLSAGERDHLVSVGWRYEGVGWRSDDAKSVPLYRQYNPNATAGAHNFTTSKGESDHLVSVGWRYEGIAWYGVAQPRPTRPSSASGGLHVSGSHLVDGAGNPVQLRGVSTHGLAWFPQYVNAQLFQELHDQWGANAVRLAMYTAEYGGYCSGGNQAELRALVGRGIKYATDSGMYAIVDWHILSDGNPNDHVAEAKAFFSDIARTYGGQGNVLYEICNEPNGGTSWQQIRDYASQVIPAIRANDPDGVVLVGTPNWCQELDKPLASPLPFDNVMYDVHFYAGTHKAGGGEYQTYVRAVQAGLPVFCTEFGITDASGNGGVDISSANSWLQTLDRYGTSWCMWSLCNKAESASAIQSSCGKTHGFTRADLTQAGNWLLGRLAGAGLTGEGDAGKTGQADGGTTPETPANGTEYHLTSNGLTVTLTLSSSWASGGQNYYQYQLCVTNPGPSDVEGWSVTIPFNQAIASVSGWNAAYSASGSTLAVRSSLDWNANLSPGGSASVGFQVTSGPGLAVAAG